MMASAKGKELDVCAVRYTADRIDPDVHAIDEACAKMVQGSQ